MAHQTIRDAQRLLFVLDPRTSAGPGPVASDNASASQSGPGEHQQAAHREPLKLHQDAAEDATRTDGLSVHLQDQPPGPAVHPHPIALTPPSGAEQIKQV